MEGVDLLIFRIEMNHGGVEKSSQAKQGEGNEKSMVVIISCCYVSFVSRLPSSPSLSSSSSPLWSSSG